MINEEYSIELVGTMPVYVGRVEKWDSSEIERDFHAELLVKQVIENPELVGQGDYEMMVGFWKVGFHDQTSNKIVCPDCVFVHGNNGTIKITVCGMESEARTRSFEHAERKLWDAERYFQSNSRDPFIRKVASEALYVTRDPSDREIADEFSRHYGNLDVGMGYQIVIPTKRGDTRGFRQWIKCLNP
jgi:hypothetical protein